MAVDTRHKRFNMLYFASPVVWSPHFEADGAVDADDRAQLLHLYGGNALDAPPAPGGAIINQFQFSNLGADLYDGTFQ